MDKLFAKLNKLKNLSSTDFKIFKVHDNTRERLNISNRNLDIIIQTATKFTPPTQDQYYTVLFEFYKESTRQDYFSTSNSLKKLCWAIDYKDNIFKESILEKDLLTTVLELIDAKFSSVFYKPLAYTLFTNWTNPKIERLRKYFNKKLVKENNARSLVRFLQSQQPYIEEVSGPSKWAADLLDKGFRSPELIFKNYPSIESSKQSEYFQLLVLDLYERIIKSSSYSNKNNWVSLFDFANENYSPSIRKYMLALEIYLFKHQMNDSLSRNLMVQKAMEVIGDPMKQSNWIIDGPLLDSQRKNIVLEAREVLLRWVNEKLINLFFTKVVDDWDRRNFWKDYTEYMTSVDIFLNSYALDEVLSNKDLTSGLETRFGLLKGGGTNSLLIFNIKKYRFVLSGSTGGGALYVHPIGSSFYPTIENLEKTHLVFGVMVRTMHKYTVVHSQLNNLIPQRNDTPDYWNEEGRLVHTGNWQYRLRNWLRRRI